MGPVAQLIVRASERMKRMRYAHILALCGLVAWLLAGAAALALEVAQKVNGAVQLGGMMLPLPAGEWTAYYTAKDDDGKFQTSKLGLVLVSGKVIKQTAYFRVTRSKLRAGFRPYEQCAQPHYFYGETILNRAADAQDCWHVHAETLAPDNPPERQKALLAFAGSNKLFLPLAVIGARFHKANRDVLLQASYGWTPDLIVKPSRDIKAWRFQDWTAEAVASVPRKRAVMAKFKRWGEEWRPRMEDAFNGKAGG